MFINSQNVENFCPLFYNKKKTLINNYCNGQFAWSIQNEKATRRWPFQLYDGFNQQLI